MTALALAAAGCGGSKFAPPAKDGGDDDVDNSAIIICNPCSPGQTGDAGGGEADAAIEVDAGGDAREGVGGDAGMVDAAATDGTDADSATVDGGDDAGTGVALEGGGPACVAGGNCAAIDCQNGTWACVDGARVCDETPAPSTTACFSAAHATSASCDGLGNCKALTCANGYVNDEGTCKVPNCAGVPCGGSDGAGGICTGSDGTCTQSGQHCNDAGQCVCDGTSCAGCCDPNGICFESSLNTCGVNGSACQTCSVRDQACFQGSCKLRMMATGCFTDSDCVPGGCFNGVCIGTISIAGAVSCGNPDLECFDGCSYPTVVSPTAPPICGNPTVGNDFIACDSPDDCAAGQDCCWVFTPGLELTQECYQQSSPGVLGSGCPIPNSFNELDVTLICDPRNPVCPSGGQCSPGTTAFSCPF